MIYEMSVSTVFSMDGEHFWQFYPHSEDWFSTAVLISEKCALLFLPGNPFVEMLTLEGTKLIVTRPQASEFYYAAQM